MAAVKAWAEKQPDKPNLSEATKRLVENGVTDCPGRGDEHVIIAPLHLMVAAARKRELGQREPGCGLQACGIFVPANCFRLYRGCSTRTYRRNALRHLICSNSYSGT
jgi:hypothetical protein